MSDNLFSPGPPPSESMDNPTPHVFSGGGGYLGLWCGKCGIDDYPSDSVPTNFCEDREWGKAQLTFLKLEQHLKATRQHTATEEAIKRARSVLTEKEWELLGIKVAPYRDIDRITV